MIHTDEIIRNNFSEKGFRLYQIENYPNKKLAYKFIKLVQKEIKGEKIIIEGQLKNPEIINKIARGRPYSFKVIIPRDQETYERNLENRFLSNPAEYGYLRILKTLDKDGKILSEFLEKKNVNVIKDLIHDGADKRYKKHAEIAEYYKKTFRKVEIIKI